MAQKHEFTYQSQTKQAYKEKHLIVWPLDNGKWTVLHEFIASSVCNQKEWVKKSEALNYALSLIDYNEEGRYIDFNFKHLDTFYMVNEEEFLLRAWDKVKDL